MPKKGYNKEAMLKALAKHNGIIYKAAKEIGCCRQLYSIYAKQDEEFREALDNVTATQIDIVEESLLKRIEEGSDTLIKFYMSTKGKNRGYRITQEVEVQEKKKVIVIKRASDNNDNE